MPFAAVNDIRLYYESHGDGPAIVFAHGAGGNHLSWWQQVPAFQNDYRCVTFDHRAFGQSHDVEGSGRGQFAADVVSLLDQLGIDRFFVVAQSMGGRTAAGLVRRVPERLRGVVFAGTTGGCVDDEIRGMQREYLHSLPEHERTLTARSLSRGYTEINPVGTFLYRQINRLNPKRPADFLALQPGYRGSFAAYLAESRVPIFFLVGEHDAITPPFIVEKSATLVSGARYAIIPDAGHSAYFERPEAFNEAVLGFVREIEASEVASVPRTPAAP